MLDDETAAVAEDAPTDDIPDTTEDQRVPLERFQQVNKQAKEAKDRAKALEKDMAALKAQMEERDNAGLPELERERKRAEQLEKRLADSEKRAEQQEQAAVAASRKAMVLAAAAAAGFDEADDALRYPEHVDLSEIETQADAERAIKRLAKARPKLLKTEEPKLPGRVLQNGKASKPGEDDVDPKAGLGEELLKNLFGGAASR